MKLSKQLIIGLFVFLTISFGANFAEAKTKIGRKAAQANIGLSGSVGAVKRGGSAKGTITMDVQGGYHVNSNRPSSSNYIPTRVSISGAGLKIAGITYPRGKSRKFSFSDEALSVYEGRVTFGFNVSVPAGFKGNSGKIRVVVNYQACNDEACFRPASKEVTLNFSVR